MITIFVFAKDLIYLKNLSNSVIQLNSNIKLVGFSNKLGLNEISICNKEKPNIIIADPIFKEELIKCINYNYFSINIPQNGNYSIQKICNIVKKFVMDSRYSYKLHIYNFRNSIFTKLVQLHFNPNLRGTHYLLDCISFLHENPYYVISKSSIKNLFKRLAFKYNTNLKSIYWNISKCIEEMCNNSSSSFKKRVFGIDTDINIEFVIRIFSNFY